MIISRTFLLIFGRKKLIKAVKWSVTKLSGYDRKTQTHWDMDLIFF